MTDIFPPVHPPSLTNGLGTMQQPNGTSHPDDSQSIQRPSAQHAATETLQEQRQHEHPSPSSSSSSSLASVAAELHARVYSFLAERHDPSSLLYRVQNQTRISLSVFQEALMRYSLRELALSYNGGKDCLVLLILFLASLHPYLSSAHRSASAGSRTRTESASSSANGAGTSDNVDRKDDGVSEDADADADTLPTSIPAIYARPPHPFPSVESFVTASSERYHLSLVRYTTQPPHSTIRTVFASYLDSHPHIRAIFVGTRRTDPHGEKLTHFDPTDRGWPDFMRIHPVIDWHYVEIWGFIRHLGVEYCPLYDEGYTSLGGTNDTHPNPKLRLKTRDGEGEPVEGPTAYRPAYELIDDEEERLGRD
ncbi:hypothetical protein VTO42DRAFT_7115 [Malbranchea cinnamomea]